MALPPNFSPTEHLQDTVKRVINKEVREWFRDVGDDNWDPDLSSDRAHLRVACTHREDDSIQETLVRLQLFQVTVGQAAAYQPLRYSIPIEDRDSVIKYSPQVRLYFCERTRDVEQGFHPVEGEVTFRLVGETSETIAQAKVNQIANKIKTLFGANGGYDWHKGWYKYVYLQPERGYDFRLFAYSEIEAKQLITKVLDIQNHTPDWTNFNKVDPENAAARFPTNPGTKRILGKVRKKPRKRPRAHVRFRYADLALHELPNPIVLYDLTGRARNPIAV